jgi:hypothetical protein
MVGTSLSTGYLNSKQRLIWDLKSNGIPEATIARRLYVTRQTVHKALKTANSKVCESLEEAAKINKIAVKSKDPAKGFLVGYSPHFKTKAIVTFSAKNGIQIWYKHEGDCKNCEQLQTCTDTLLQEARDRNIPLSDQSSSMVPSEFAKNLFSRITGEIE